MPVYFPISDHPVPNSPILEDLDIPAITMSESIEMDHEVPTTSSHNDNVRLDDNEEPTSFSAINKLDVIRSHLNSSLDIDFSSVTLNTQNRRFPVKLLNEGVNVCFFNSIIQALYSLPLFHTYLEQTTIDNKIVKELKRLFKIMLTSNIVRTSTYIKALENKFIGYRYKDQYDAEECLREILNVCFPYYHESASIENFDSNKFIFRVQVTQTTKCEVNKGGCGIQQDDLEHRQILKLNINETYNQQTVQSLIQNYHEDDIPEDYRCQLGPSGGCEKINSCNRLSFITQVKDVLVIQLAVFRYDVNGGARKFTPNLTINNTFR